MSVTYELAACPACGGESARLIADREALAAELEELWQFHLSRRRENVPTGQLYDRAFFTLDPPLQLVACNECGTLYRNPREAQAAVVETYEEEQAEAGVLEALFQTQKRAYRAQAQRLTRLAGKPGHGLELGSYVGAFLAAAKEFDWDFEGADVNPHAVAFAQGKGLRVRPGTLDSVQSPGSFDAIAIWNCFDQLPDPRATLTRANALLRTGGMLAIRVPNGHCYKYWRNDVRPGALARLVLAHNNLLGFPYRQGFTPDSLSELLQRTGFEIVKLQPDVLVPTSDAWTRRWAVWEERAVKRLLRWSPARWSPWFEVYAAKARFG